MILKDAITDQRAETIARNMAVLSGGSVGVARCPHKWSEYKKAVIPNTLSKSKNLGTALREGRASGSDPIELIKQALDTVEDQDIKQELLARLKILNPKPKNLAKCNVCGKEFKARRYGYRLQKTCYGCLNKARSSQTE